MEYLVLRFLGRELVRTYGPFEVRGVAEAVALRAAEKYPAGRVEVRPVAPRRT